MVTDGLNSVCLYSVFQPFETTDTLNPVVDANRALKKRKHKRIADAPQKARMVFAAPAAFPAAIPCGAVCGDLFALP